MRHDGTAIFARASRAPSNIGSPCQNSQALYRNQVRKYFSALWPTQTDFFAATVPLESAKVESTHTPLRVA